MSRRRIGFDNPHGEIGFDNPEFWNFMYDDETAPCLIDGPQPVIAELESEGLCRRAGTVCGSTSRWRARVSTWRSSRRL